MDRWWLTVVSSLFIVHLFQHSLVQLVTSGALFNRQGNRGTEHARRVSRPTQPRLPCVSLTCPVGQRTPPCLCTEGQGLGARGRGLGLLPQAPGLAPRHSAAASPTLPGVEGSLPAWLRPGASPLPAPACTWHCWRLSLCTALSLEHRGHVSRCSRWVMRNKKPPQPSQSHLPRLTWPSGRQMTSFVP